MDVDIIDCPVGFYCPAVDAVSSESPTPCDKGQYQPNLNALGVDWCLECPPGKYCANTGMELPSGNCDGGFYCRTSSSLNNPIAADSTEALKWDACPYGYYCPEGTSEPFPCPIGTYSSTSGLTSHT